MHENGKNPPLIFIFLSFGFVVVVIIIYTIKMIANIQFLLILMILEIMGLRFTMINGLLSQEGLNLSYFI